MTETTSLADSTTEMNCHEHARITEENPPQFFSSLFLFWPFSFNYSLPILPSSTPFYAFFSSHTNSLTPGKAQQWQNDRLRTLQIPYLSNSCNNDLVSNPNFIGNPQIFYNSTLKNAQKEKNTISDTFERKQTVMKILLAKKKKKVWAMEMKHCIQ